jgi:type I restriction-modification system DNA methylase subunit
MYNWHVIYENALAFSSRWKKFQGLERQHDQQFITELLSCFGVKAGEVGVFQEKAGNSWIDYLWPGMLGVEMKSPGQNLSKAMTQLYNYLPKIPEESVPKYLLVSDFNNFLLLRLLTKDRYEFKTSNFYKNVEKFADIVGDTSDKVYGEQEEVNVRAADMMARLHDALKSHGYDGHNLEVYLVRLLFCLFAEDTGIFTKNSFKRYIEKSKLDGSDLSERIAKLFEILNLPDQDRAKRNLLSDELKRFRYLNGSLFVYLLPSAEFDKKMRQILLDCTNFDWSKISPAIFGAMFQGVMSQEQRRELGAHYTSEENILKLIKPLFLDELRAEFDKVKIDTQALKFFYETLPKLKFLDPACGCGNFLIITYRELRLLELDILNILYWKTPLKQLLDISGGLKVSIEQFYGIELEDFPCQIAHVGMWLVDHQMNLLVSEQFGSVYVRLPLTQSVNIVQGNALRMDWESVIPKEKLSYILGNPPFVGYSNQNKEQKADIINVYVDENGKPFTAAGKVDYVTAWYYKAVKYISGTQIRVAFVSTNSITQGEQVAYVWKPLFDLFGIHIDFAYRTFKWSNDTKGKAAVYCVIVGFSLVNSREKLIYDGVIKTKAKNINPYLIDSVNIFIESRTNPICDVPMMVYGNKPTDGGHLFISAEEYEDFIAKEPLSAKYIKQIYGSEEYIYGIKRYCLWLVGANPGDLKKMPYVMERIEKVRKFRLSSKKIQTRESAALPSLFQEIRQPKTDYIIVPRISSERRKYIPLGFISPDIISNDAVLMIPSGTLYHFGILTSSVHMAWLRAVGGRLKNDYRYSKDIVYNNFPWPVATEEQKNIVATQAQDVLDKRLLFPDSNLATLYDPLLMPPELLKAHNDLDRAVMKLYGVKERTSQSESAVVAKLMELYQSMVEGR